MDVYIINLARAKERREFMQKQIDFLNQTKNNLNLDFHFFSAIDGSKNELETFLNNNGGGGV